MLGFGFVTQLEVEKRQVRMHQLLFGPQRLGLVALSHRRGVIALAAQGHSQGKLGVEVLRILRQDFLESSNGTVEVPGAEGEHRFVVTFVRIHGVCGKRYRTRPALPSMRVARRGSVPLCCRTAEFTGFASVERHTTMTPPIRLISTDFDGTLFAEFEMPPVPEELVSLIAALQARGTKWVINTGRDMSSLMEALARARVPVQPDFLVLVEREIFIHDGVRYAPHASWNGTCERDHEELFARIRPEVPGLMAWVNARFRATVYADPFSPFCLIAGNNGDADAIHAHLESYCAGIPNLAVVRNDVYARFSHAAYNKGTALAELSRLTGAKAAEVFAAGDHLNDLPMLSKEYAGCLVSPANAIPAVKAAVRRQNGFVSRLPCGNGVVEGLKHYLRGFSPGR